MPQQHARRAFSSSAATSHLINRHFRAPVASNYRRALHIACAQTGHADGWPSAHASGAGCCAAATCAALLLVSPGALAARNRLPPPTDDPNRCTLAALDKFADTRAAFSQEASSGMEEAYVDVRNCDYSKQDLSKKVFSGVLMRNANFANCRFTGVEFARVDAKGADLSNSDFTDVNGYNSIFDGADLENSQFENAILTGATFGKDASGKWANLKGAHAGAHFEGALLAASDIQRMCDNPTLEDYTKKSELGCKVSSIKAGSTKRSAK